MQDVVIALAVDLVVAVIAEQPVDAEPAVDRVIAAAAAQHVVAVGAVDRVGIGVAGLGIADQVVDLQFAVDDVEDPDPGHPGIADQHVHVRRRPERVAGGAAAQEQPRPAIGDQPHLEGVAARIAHVRKAEHHAGIAVLEVDHLELKGIGRGHVVGEDADAIPGHDDGIAVGIGAEIDAGGGARRQGAVVEIVIERGDDEVGIFEGAEEGQRLVEEGHAAVRAHEELVEGPVAEQEAGLEDRADAENFGIVVALRQQGAAKGLGIGQECIVGDGIEAVRSGHGCKTFISNV